MLIIPAIDLKDGRCVRLFQGEMDKETVYFENPLDAAKHWLAEGATFLHIGEVQVEGKRRIAARDFLNGSRLGVGDCISDTRQE